MKALKTLHKLNTKKFRPYDLHLESASIQRQGSVIKLFFTLQILVVEKLTNRYLKCPIIQCKNTNILSF
jgi:hypothetical protein